MGGDSIRAIQIVSQLRKKNLILKVRDLFQYPTIKQLSEKVIESVHKNQEMVSGVVPLTAITSWFFKEFSFDKHHFNHSEMFYAKEGFNEKALRAVFLKIQEHHDALRMIYKFKDDKVIQEIRDLSHPFYFQKIDLRDSEKEVEKLESQIKYLQESLDLENGPLMKVALFKLNDGDRLLVILHHLIVDGISWRILLEDIISGYKQYLSSKSITLPLKTHSFKDWAESIQLYSTSDSLLKEKKYWQKIESTPLGTLPYDNIESENNSIMENAITLGFSLSVSETNLLVTKATKAYQTSTHEILLTGLAYAMKKWHGHKRTLISLEGHGRQDIIKHIDVSRTVGWFTSTYPVILESPDTENAADQIETIKQILQNIPCYGMGYSILKYITPENLKKDMTFTVKPDVSFNYLGHFNDICNGVFEIAKDSPGHSISKNAKIIHGIDINAIIDKQQLKLYIMFDQKRFKIESIEGIIRHFQDKLRDIIRT
jgi:non-ribosomal peptide synthase protein (TIGR01720 family)